MSLHHLEPMAIKHNNETTSDEHITSCSTPPKRPLYYIKLMKDTDFTDNDIKMRYQRKFNDEVCNKIKRANHKTCPTLRSKWKTEKKTTGRHQLHPSHLLPKAKDEEEKGYIRGEREPDTSEDSDQLQRSGTEGELLHWHGDAVGTTQPN
eukprot:1355043-Amphidinium_carterae.1